MIPLSPYQQHVERWRDCTRCSLHHCRNRTVFARGRIPCDVLMVGEAPGESEDLFGVPFYGPAGDLLDSIIQVSVPERLRVGYTNVVCCIPRGEDGRKGSAPMPTEIVACGPRLAEFVRIAAPRLVVLVGALSRDWFPSVVRGWKGPTVEITHPAAILRQNEVVRDMQIKRCVIAIRNACEEHLGVNP